ncbi:MAG TPA: hypothetical protein VEW46_07295 [Pyrinomonadaceae bacterium]|nr:hypothetical protein [Pyrinomonadaceae bacterium]
MRFMKLFLVAALLLVTLLVPAADFNAKHQKKTTEVNKPAQLVRTTVRHERRRLPYGGTLTLVGAPAGSITIEAWSNSEVDITAEVQLKADTEQDLDRLALVNNVVVDDEPNHVRIFTTGTHDKSFMKQVKKFPKTLLGLPWKVDYRIRVPVATDLDVNAGRGPITIKGIEGTIQLSAAESETNLNLSGGTVNATIALGKVTLVIPVKSWRRGGVNIRVAVGEVNVELPPGFAADLDGEILRSGQIVNTHDGLEVREKPGITPRLMKARAGAGGTWFRFTVGDGTINIKKTP